MVAKKPSPILSDVSAILTRRFPSPEQIAFEVKEQGFKVYADAIDEQKLFDMKEFWVSHFHQARDVKRQALRGAVRLGEANFTGHSVNKMWNIYRNFDFLWNRPEHEWTRKMCIDIHRIRNLAQGFEPDYGLKFEPDCYGVYISTSLYPNGRGFLEPHSDGHRDTPILQFMVNLTHFGEDYNSGGLYLVNGNQKRIDVEPLMKSGSVLFFDGRLIHGVDPVRDSRVGGRVATFGIPTFFRVQDELPSWMRRLEDFCLRFSSRQLRSGKSEYE